MLIAFKDAGDGFYQAEVENENDVPEWARNFTRLTEAERQAALAAAYQGNPDPGPPA